MQAELHCYEAVGIGRRELKIKAFIWSNADMAKAAIRSLAQPRVAQPYIPAFAAEMKARIDLNIIKPLVASGKVSRYQAIPEYEGRSFVPVSISISATHPESFTSRVAIWGKGLK